MDDEDTLAEDESVRTGEELVRGESVDRYVILDRIGAGGMGVVYAAYDPELDRKVAIKQLRGDAREQSSLGRTRLAREARAMAQLSHPNVVTVHDVGESRGAVFIAMEFVEGRTLREWVAKQPSWHWQEVLRVYIDAARGLSAAHAAGLVHRDFKPENVMLGDDGRVRVMDFGLARGGHEPELSSATLKEREPAAEHSLTRAGAIMGSPAYMSPEQHLGEPADARSDQFSFCVALHEAFYGRRPFLGESLIELATKITAGERTRPPKARELPGWIYPVLERGLARDPAQRWPSMAALIEQLDRKPQRRSWLTGVGVVLTIAAVIALVAGQQASQQPSEPVDPCTAGDRHIAEVWNDERRAALEASLLATEQPWAAQTWSVVGTELDAYAERWQAGWRDACEATHVRHEQSGQRLDQRMECLERRRNELAGLLEGLGHADTLSAADRVVFDLSAVEACADPAYLDDQGQLPEDPREAAEVEALLAEIDHLSGRQAAGDHAQLVDRVEQSLTRARGLGHPLLLIEALTLAATSAVHVGEIERTRERFEEAYFIARAEGYDHAAAKLSTKLLFHARDVENPIQATRSWMRHAQADVERAGADPILQAMLWGRMAAAYELSGEFEQAESHARKAVALLEDTHGTLHPNHIEMLSHLAQILAKRAKYTEAAEIYQQALELVRTRLGDRHPTMAQLRNNYAVVLVHDAQFELALQHIEAARALYVELYGPNHPSLPAALSNQAQALQGLGDYEGALHLCLEAVEQRVKLHGPEHPNVAWAQASAASQLNRLGRHDEALAVATAAVELTIRQYGPDSHLLAYGLVEQGIAEHGLGRGRAARATLERALALRDGSDADPSTVATVEWPLARVTWDLGEHDRALELARSAREIYAGDAPLWRPTIVEIDAWLAERAE